jgi:hypothetical protein
MLLHFPFLNINIYHTAEDGNFVCRREAAINKIGSNLILDLFLFRILALYLCIVRLCVNYAANDVWRYEVKIMLDPILFGQKLFGRMFGKNLDAIFFGLWKNHSRICEKF